MKRLRLVGTAGMASGTRGTAGMSYGTRGMGAVSNDDEHIHNDPNGRLWIIEHLAGGPASEQRWRASSDSYPGSVFMGTTRALVVARVDDFVSPGNGFYSPEFKRDAAIAGLASGTAMTGLAYYVHENHPVWAGILGFLGVSSLVSGAVTLASSSSNAAAAPKTGTGSARRRVRMAGR